MNIDIHVHIVDLDSILIDAGNKPGFFLRKIANKAVLEVKELFTDKNYTITEKWVQRLLGWVRESQLDKIVLLAFDQVYSENGQPISEKTKLLVGNDFVSSITEQYSEFLFGGSIHPYRKDAVAELERLIKKGLKLIKWIPSSQYIEPDNKLCFKFYEALAHYKIPLLTHTGLEHTLGWRRMYYNHPVKLEPALKKGVDVIAAHCGTHLFLHEPSFFGSWKKMALNYENFYGDTGAFSIVTRIPYLRKILRNDQLKGKLVYGSDFPLITSPAWCWQLGMKRIKQLSIIKNPLERNICTMQQLGISEEIFQNTGKLLNL